MNRDDIIKLAREAGEYADQHHEKHDSWLEAERLQFAALVAAADRERIAALVEQMGIDGYGTLAIAAAIRKGQA
jgi:hypothetical protein